jgi:hypothetical protein
MKNKVVIFLSLMLATIPSARAVKFMSLPLDERKVEKIQKSKLIKNKKNINKKRCVILKFHNDKENRENQLQDKATLSYFKGFNRTKDFNLMKCQIVKNNKFLKTVIFEQDRSSSVPRKDMSGIFSRLSKYCSLQSIHFIQPVEPDLVSQLSKLNLNENENPNTHTFFDSVMKCLPKIESLRQ